jgi:hypothetical protein
LCPPAPKACGSVNTRVADATHYYLPDELFWIKRRRCAAVDDQARWARTLAEPQHGREDKVAVRLRFRGTYSGEILGFPATGRTIADGLIAEE